MIAGDVFCVDCGATAPAGVLAAIGHRCAPGQPRRADHLEVGMRALVATFNEVDARTNGPDGVALLLRLRRRRALAGEQAL